MNVYEETQLILHKYKIQANKSLGQNFLVDDNVIDEIIRSSNIDKQDLIIEIGPGLGVLTNRLLKEANNLIAVELDKRMVNILQDRFILNINDQAESKLEIINEDILKINLNEIIAEKRKQTEIKNVKIVANLPYYISTPIIMKLLENRLDIDEIIVMVQKEVAERLTAKTGTRLAGAITYAVEYYSDATSIIKVPKESFVPSPKVESEVIKLKVRKGKKIQVKDEKLLFNIISKCFMQRRKTLSNVLINNNIMHSKEDVKNIVDWCNERHIGFYLEANSGMYCNDYMLEQGPETMVKYAKGKGASLENAKSSAQHFIDGFIHLQGDELYRDDVNKISFILRTYQDHLDSKVDFPHLVANTWGGKGEVALFGDLGPTGITKRHAIEVLLDYLHADPKDTISFGDAKIDLSMFECCAYNVAMGNGGSEIKEAADYITDDVNEDGLYNAFKY